MNKELKQEIKLEVKKIVDEIEYEENQFNKYFHSNVEFQKAYCRFLTIYEKYGKDAYLKFVPLKYKKQEIKNLIYSQNYVGIYEHYGMNTLKKLQFTQNLYKDEFNVTNKFKLLIIKLKKLFSTNFISLPSNAVLALPENVCENLNCETSQD